MCCVCYDGFTGFSALLDWFVVFGVLVRVCVYSVELSGACGVWLIACLLVILWFVLMYFKCLQVWCLLLFV